MTDLLDDPRTQVPGLRVLTDAGDRESYRRDETVHFEPGLPLAVALPSATDEIATILRLATKHQVANLVAVIKPDVINADLKAAVANAGLFYAPDPASFELCTTDTSDDTAARPRRTRSANPGGCRRGTSAGRG